MFKIVSNIVEATGFPTKEHVQTTLNSVARSNPEMNDYVFVIQKVKTLMLYVRVSDKNNVILGYAKVDKVSNISTNTIIDGVCSPKVSDCRELVVL